MAKVSLDLTGRWEFKQYPQQARRMHDLETVDWHATNVPSSIFDSLIQAGLIKKEELYSSPEKFFYVNEKSWVFRKVFETTDEFMQCERKELVFDGLDTVAHIWFNNKLIGKTNNMFISHRFDVTELAHRGANSLVVKFEPAAEYAGRLMNRYGRLGESDFSNPCRVYIRKAQCQFGWDFCPPLAGCGIWQGCRLEGVRKARIEELSVRTVECNEHYADIKVSIKLDIVTKADFFCRIIISNDEQEVEQELVFKEGEDFHSGVIRIDRPSLWWPRGYGKQSLYRIAIELSEGDEIIERMHKKIGIRTVKLVCSDDKERGSTLSTSSGQAGSPSRAQSRDRRFAFEINGRAVYIRGANWVPASIFAGSLKTEDYQRLLSAAAEAGVNMLRVWGGGYYETEDFYELCDKLGITVWQDFMFACAYYPDRGFFIKEVEREASSVIKRLKNHPSIVLWCGNNEIDWMHYSGKLGRGKKFYGREIYHKLLPRLIAEQDVDIPYIPTTPFGDAGSFKNDRPLTVHRWDVWTDYKPFSEYLGKTSQTASFVTEFGLQSMPSMAMLKDFCGCDKPYVGSAVVEKHNYQTGGPGRLCRYISDLFGPVEDVGHFVYLSQVTQARATKLYVEHLRANKRANSGCLFWQFNDSFPAISWSAIDFYGKPKALYYYAKRFFSELLLTVGYDVEVAKIGQSGLLNPTKILFINDSSEQITATIKCRLVDLRGNVVDEVTFPISASPFSVFQTMKLPRAISNPAKPESCVLQLLLEKDGVRKAENVLLYLPDKYIIWPEAKIRKELIELGDGIWKLKFRTDVFVKDLRISCPEPVNLSDNFLDVFSDREEEIIIKAEKEDSNFPRDVTICLDSVNTHVKASGC